MDSKVNDQHTFHKNGTYAAVYLNAQSQQEIHKIINSVGIPRDDELDELHCTVLYSRKPFPQAIQVNFDFDYCQAYPIRYESWEGENDKTYLVLIIECAPLKLVHEEFIKDGATHDYDEYSPHITISDTWDNRVPVSSIPVPNEPLEFSKFIVTALKED